MIYIEVKNNNIEFALRKLKQQIKDTQLFIELKKKSYYQKPSEIRKEKKAKAKSRSKYQKIHDKNSPF